MRGDVLTLPEMLMLLGYRTYFSTAIEMAYLPVRGRVVAERYAPPAGAHHVLGELAKWILKDTEKKFFAYVHLGDLHVGVMDPPAAFRSFFGDVIRPIQKGDIRSYALLYDNALRYVDSAIERTFRHLQKNRLAGRTLVVVTGDHGEEFFEHAEQEKGHFYDQRGFYGFGHGHHVFGVNIEVPLLLSGPVPARKPDHMVSAVDIVPTILNLMKVKPLVRFDGQDLFSEYCGERHLLSESTGYGYEKKAMIVGRYKLIYSKEDGVQWLFDLEKDPQERCPIVDDALTSVFVERLNRMMMEDERRRVAKTMGKKSWSRTPGIRTGSSAS
ncbi:MAG: hypothetical protein A2Y91_07265 [Chloroflexi bacterium RBG_13_54_8]|nr:MAG: hypothetical protein A2Y91_07265 [Chloroflexi bacterium RBG_13_54_8]